jgi:WD40 repeat protein
MQTTSLCLGSTDNDFVRRFALLPFAGKAHTIAYGGDDGSITLIEGDMVKTCRRFSERIRSVVSSYDGKRIAIGFGDGSTTVFAYESLDGDFHPFLSSLRKSDDDDGIFSQIDDVNEENVEEVYFSGPCFQTPVRSLVFDPRESYMLACGSEDSGFCIVDATSLDTIIKKRFLAEQSAIEHNETGIRGLAYHEGKSKTILASLDLQGRLCVWDVTGSDPELDYELLHKDGHKCVMKVDQGDINDSEPADQACFPVFCKSFLGLPGSCDLQLRSVEAVDKHLFLSSVDGKGHLEPIVSLAFSEDCKYAVTSGRDERIVLWKMEQNVRSFARCNFLSYFQC